MNIVALIGNVASEPELRHTAQGRAVCNFRIAVSRPGKEEADFFTIVAWERQGELAKEYLEVGRRVGIEGRLHTSTWEISVGGEQQKRSKVEVVAYRIQFLGRNSGAETEDATGHQSSHDREPVAPIPGGDKSDDDIPF